jgi:hypothetical protein
VDCHGVAGHKKMLSGFPFIHPIPKSLCLSLKTRSQVEPHRGEGAWRSRISFGR